MRSKFIAFLGTCQALLLMGGGALYLAGVDVPWMLLLIPLWILFGVAVIFWGILGALVAKFGK